MLRSALLLLALLTPPLAIADDTPSVLLGAGLWSRPAYDGADTSRTMLIPVVRYYGQPWFARTTFGMLEGGARMELLSGLTLGTQLAYEGGRDSSESAFLAGHKLDNIAPSASIGMHLELEKNLGAMPLIALLRYRQDVNTDRGAQTDLRLTAGIYGGAQLNAGVFVQTTWADAKAAQYYHGLTAQQAASAGLATYLPEGGALYNAAGFLWSYEVDNHWMLLGSLETRRMRDVVLNSPLLQTETGHYVSLGAAWQF
jgi:outer membrane scaffolding protein for murein synthesis (MipA/OmpV family)